MFSRNDRTGTTEFKFRQASTEDFVIHAKHQSLHCFYDVTLNFLFSLYVGKVYINK